MRKVFTLIFLLAALKLSAVAVHADTSKTAGSNHSADSAKEVVVKSDSGVLKKAPAQTDSLNLTASLPAVTAGRANNDMPGAPPYNNVPAPEDNLRRITSIIQLDSLKATLVQEQIRQEQLRKLVLKNEQLKIAELLRINNLDSLKQELTLTESDTLKAVLNTRIALKYLNYDTVTNKDKRYEYQNLAINYTLQAIRQYSIYNDSIGLRVCYDNLAKVYHDQQKFPQAKWFILQSNTLSRAKNDTPNIITSLLTLATIKSDIKDYTLAMGDLNEALQLSITTHAPRTEVEVLKNYAQLYNLLQNYPKETEVLKKRDSLLDSLRRSDEALLAKIAMQKKRQELVQAKKKLYTINLRKLSKNSSPAKIASL